VHDLDSDFGFRVLLMSSVDSFQKYGMFPLSESGFQEMTISKQLLLSFLTVGVGAIGIVSYFFYHDARNALIDRAFEQLTSVKTLKKTKLQDLFAALSERASQLASMADIEARLQNPKEREALSRNLETLVVLDSTGKVALGQLPCPIVPIASRAPTALSFPTSSFATRHNRRSSMSAHGLKAKVGFCSFNPLMLSTKC
jgi:hypothetical protein